MLIEPVLSTNAPYPPSLLLSVSFHLPYLCFSESVLGNHICLVLSWFCNMAFISPNHGLQQDLMRVSADNFIFIRLDCNLCSKSSQSYIMNVNVKMWGSFTIMGDIKYCSSNVQLIEFVLLLCRVGTPMLLDDTWQNYWTSSTILYLSWNNTHFNRAYFQVYVYRIVALVWCSIKLWGLASKRLV